MKKHVIEPDTLRLTTSTAHLLRSSTSLPPTIAPKTPPPVFIIIISCLFQITDDKTRKRKNIKRTKPRHKNQILSLNHVSWQCSHIAFESKSFKHHNGHMTLIRNLGGLKATIITKKIKINIWMNESARIRSPWDKENVGFICAFVNNHFWNTLGNHDRIRFFKMLHPSLKTSPIGYHLVQETSGTLTLSRLRIYS